MNSVQSAPLKKRKSWLQKIKNFFDDIPDQQIAVINEASYKRPPQIKKSYSLQGSYKQGDVKHKYSEELIDEIHEFEQVKLDD